MNTLTPHQLLEHAELFHSSEVVLAAITRLSDQIAEVLTVARPLIKKIPLIGHIADSEVMVRAEGLSKVIVTSAQNTRKIIGDLQQALIEANPKYLKIHLEDLRRYRDEVNRLLIGKD